MSVWCGSCRQPGVAQCFSALSSERHLSLVLHYVAETGLTSFSTVFPFTCNCPRLILNAAACLVTWFVSKCCRWSGWGCHFPLWEVINGDLQGLFLMCFIPFPVNILGHRPHFNNLIINWSVKLTALMLKDWKSCGDISLLLVFGMTEGNQSKFSL